MKTIINKKCRMCSSEDFDLILDLGNHPLVNSLISKDELNNEDPVFP